MIANPRTQAHEPPPSQWRHTGPYSGLIGGRGCCTRVPAKRTTLPFCRGTEVILGPCAKPGPRAKELGAMPNYNSRGARTTKTNGCPDWAEPRKRGRKNSRAVSLATAPGPIPHDCSHIRDHCRREFTAGSVSPMAMVRSIPSLFKVPGSHEGTTHSSAVVVGGSGRDTPGSQSSSPPIPDASGSHRDQNPGLN
jgi:hypothetical protein